MQIDAAPSRPPAPRRTNVARLGAAIAAGALLALIGWSLVVGPVTAWRILVYNVSNHDDHVRLPGRPLMPSAAPFRFVERAAPSALQVPARGATMAPLDEVLAANDTLAFLVIKDDALTYERYFGGHTAAAISMTFSMSKAFFSLLIGFAIDDGLIRSADQKITDFVPEVAARGFDQVTFAHLLQMTSGSDYVENDNPMGVHARYYYTDRLAAEILQQRASQAPGRHWRYKSGDTALASLALARALAPRSITDYAQEKLWSPLGMEFGALWLTDRAGDGLERVWCCLAAAARDVAKLGRLALNGGAWNGRQMLSKAWVDLSTGQVPQAAYKVPNGFARASVPGYGYGWWLGPERDYLASGHLGQYLYVNPERRAIVVRMGRSAGKLSFAEWLRLMRFVAAQAQ